MVIMGHRVIRLLRLRFSVLAACALGIAVAGTVGGQDAPVQLSGEQKADLAYHSANLSAPSATAASRERAAQHLIRLQIPQASSALAAALRSGVPEQVAAVIDAMEMELHAPIALAQPLIEVASAFADAEQDLAHFRAIGAVFSKWGASGVSELAIRAENTDAAIEQRVAAARILGEVRGSDVAPASVQTLIALIDPTRAEPEELRNVAFDGLSRVAGLDDFGCDANRWIQWWREMQDTSPEMWLPDQVDRLNVRIESLTRDLQTERGMTTAYQAQLTDLMNRLYFTLAEASEEEMFTQLAAWIRDDFSPVRRNAINRASTRVANQSPLSEDVQLALAERLTADTESALRRLAARTLDRQNYPGLGDMVARALVADTDETSTSLYLEMLQRRPVAAAVAPATGLLSVPQFRNAAADVVRACARADLVTDEQRQSALTIIRTFPVADLTGSVVQLIGAIGEEEDVLVIVGLLDGDDTSLRRIVAEALRPHAFARDDLFQRGGDAAVYPVLLDMVADDDEPTPETCDRLVQLAPPENDQRTLWWTAIARLAARLPAIHLAHLDQGVAAIADEFLSLRERADARVAILSRAVTITPDELPTAERQVLLMTLAEQALLTSDANLAKTALDSVHANGNGNDTGESLARETRLRLIAALILAEYEAAATLDAGPATWIEAAQWLAGADAERAGIIATEISTRFTELDEAQREQVQRLASNAPEPAEGSQPEEAGE